MTGSATGQTYHPVYAPAPPEVQSRLVWRLDDTPEVVQKRCADFRKSVTAILDVFKGAGVPIKWVDNARSELESFEDAAAFLEDTARHKLRETGGWSAACQELLCDLERVSAPMVDQDDVAPMCSLDEEELDECLDRFEEDASSSPPTNSLIEAVRRCNSFDLSDYLPVLVEDRQVGWLGNRMQDALAPYLAKGLVCEWVSGQRTNPRGQPTNSRGQATYASGQQQRNPRNRTPELERGRASSTPRGRGPTNRLTNSANSNELQVAIRLVPQATTAAERSAMMAALVQVLLMCC